ncbi:MAG: fumarylacetoacetate hydrolase family protein [Microthrixaceae bacterium]|nr:fumarylacetoacetate hydrolase family protein [Microthrixaceae bacterium]
MRFANQAGRGVIVLDDGVADLEAVSGGRLGPDPMAALQNWDEVVQLAASVDRATGPLDEGSLGCPVPRPRQVFAIGLNYAAHAAETGKAVPEVPATFTKFPASLAGPHDEIEVVGETVDWEVELVAVVGRRADRVAASEGWGHIAGLTIGQDVTDRTLQVAAGAQFSLGKSRRGFGPMGPWVVSTDEFDDPDDLALGCSVDGETVQDSRTSDMVFSVPQLVAELSAVVPLLPGDVIFTGTPAGVGVGRTPPRFLAPGNVLETWIEGIGEMRNPCV